MGPVGAAVMQAPPEGRTYLGATIRPSALPHIHHVSDLLGFPSSSDFFRAAIAHFAAAHRHRLTDAAAAESLAVLVTIAEDVPRRRASRRMQQQEAR